MGDLTQMLMEATVKVSMDGRGCRMGNLMIERLWRSLKYACARRNAFETGASAYAGIGKWIAPCNAGRRIRPLGGRTQVEPHRGPGLEAA